MYCKNCGNKLEGNIKFCPNCGCNLVSEDQSRQQNSTLMYTLKPTFNFLYKLLESIYQSLYLILLFVFFYLENINDLDSVKELMWIILIIIGVFVVIKLIIGKLQYNYLEYNFYNDKVEYKDGFINKEQKTLKYENIREVSMKKNILERICGIGTIRMFTSASSNIYEGRRHSNMNGRNGIYIHCVKNVEEEYNKIKQIMNK